MSLLFGRAILVNIGIPPEIRKKKKKENNNNKTKRQIIIANTINYVHPRCTQSSCSLYNFLTKNLILFGYVICHVPFSHIHLPTAKKSSLPLAQLPNTAHINDPIMKMIVHLGHVSSDEHAVHVDTVSSQGNLIIIK